MQRRQTRVRTEEQLDERLTQTGLRPTAQRRHVYQVLLQKRDHPTADEVFIRAKREMPDISMATVYNCLEAFVRCGLVREVYHDRGATRYCSNMRQHHHFYCDSCGGAFDIDSPPPQCQPCIRMPPGFQVQGFEIAFRGVCPDCGARPAHSPNP